MSDRDYALHTKVNNVSSQVDDVTKLVLRAQQQITAVSAEVNTVATTQRETRTELGQLRADFSRFVRQAELTANLAQAHIKVGNLQDELDSEFGHHKKVRRAATGLLQAFDVGLVSQDTVRSIGEQLMIDAPRYWLAPALVAMSAWSGDEQSLCNRAVQTAFSRSPSRTSLFFALILRRQGRLQSATRWLRHYLDALTPVALGRDFAVVLESVAQGAFGAAARDLVQEKLADWTDKLSTDQDATAQQVARWHEEILKHRGGTSTGDFPQLAQLCPQWTELDEALRSAGAHQQLLDVYLAMLAEEPTPSASLEDAVDDILDRLVSEYDTEELPIRRELDLQEAIIACLGDLDLAQHQADVEGVARGDTLDYLTIQSTSALLPDRIGVSRATQRVAVSACEPWFRLAHGQYSLDYRQRLPGDVQAEVTSNQAFTNAAFQLPPWRGSFTSPMPTLEQDLGRHWDASIVPFVNSLRYNWGKAAVLPVAVVLVGFLILASSHALVFGLLAALIVGGIWAAVIRQRGMAVEQTRIAVEKALLKAKSESLGQLRQAGAELVDWTSKFQTEDVKEAEVREMFDALKLAGHPVQAFEQRSFSS